jgi:hypothetical protein
MPEDFTHHDDVTLYSGDGWTIDGTLLDASGNAFDLTGAALTWRLLDADGRALPASEAATITVVEPASDGKIIISVPDDATAGLPPGFYVDALRADDSAGKRSTLWSGRIMVSADLFT